MEKDVWIGIDVGSVSVKLAALFENGEDNFCSSSLAETGYFFIPPAENFRFLNGKSLLLSCYERHYGEPLEFTTDLLKRLLKEIPEQRIAGIWTTGSGAKLCCKMWDFRYLNEYKAVAAGVSAIYPEARTIFEIGGERSKYIRISHGGNGEIQIVDYESNGECAAGTGSFFDQQVERLKYRIEEVGKVVGTIKRSASIAGRCSVFAKSDMIHAQQRGYTPPEVLKGLCEAVVRNYKGCVTKGKQIESKVVFIGRVAANRGIVNAFRKLFDLSDGKLVVPELHAWMGAIGGALVGSREQCRQMSIGIKSVKKETKKVYPATRPLSLEKLQLLRDQARSYRFIESNVVNGFLGIDVGSVSTNLAIINSEGDLIHGIYRMTEGRPIEVVKDSLLEMASAVGDKVQIMGVGTTGSGRELIGVLVGADVVKDEITAHKTGAIHICRKYLNLEVDTIFEVGGQDSKFISIRDGVVVDFSLNEACAAGTGSFLEEQARQIGVDIRGEFAELALKSRHPLKLGERCTVFMEKELIPYLQQGVSKEDIVAGLAMSVVRNYLNRVVKKRKIGNVIFFQGGTAYNDSVAAAFATVLDKQIIVPPHNGIIGAIGAALLARYEKKSEEGSFFRGWDLSKVSWYMREFNCNVCSNTCTIQEFNVQGEKTYWGDKCSDKYRKRTKTCKRSIIPDLVRLRENRLFSESHIKKKIGIKRRKIGIPRALYFFDRFPFWKTYFETLGFEIVLTGPTHRDLINAGVESAVAEPCFPIQVVHGHLVNLLNYDMDFIFLPNVINEEDQWDSAGSFFCPWAQTIPLVAEHAPVLTGLRDRLLCPNIQFREGKRFVVRQLRREIADLGVGSKENRYAVQKAYQAQVCFRDKIIQTGKEVLAEVIEKKVQCIILLGRPYNLYDPGLNLNIPAKLRDIYGVNVIPMDFLPIDEIDINKVHDHMFWNYGRKIIQAAKFTKDFPNFHIIYFSNFKCGPDSYIRHYIEEACGTAFLLLQLDSHANDAGVMTRIEAFLESKGML